MFLSDELAEDELVNARAELRFVVGEEGRDGFELALFVKDIHPLLPEWAVVFKDGEALLSGCVDLGGGEG